MDENSHMLQSQSQLLPFGLQSSSSNSEQHLSCFHMMPVSAMGDGGGV